MLKTNDIENSGNIFDVFHVKNMSEKKDFFISHVGLQNQKTNQCIELTITKMEKVGSRIKNVCEYRLSVEKEDLFNIKELICYINLQSGKLTGYCSSNKPTGSTWKLNRVFCKVEV